MLKPQVQHSQSSTALLLLPKPFIHGNAQTHLSIPSKSSFTKTQKRVVGVGYKTANTKAIANVEQNKSTKVKAIVTVNRTVGGFLSNIGIDRGLDDITDLLGRTLLLELVSSELDPKTGLEKPKIKGYAHKKDEKGSEIRYEADLVVPSSFGEVGAIYVENEHHKEMFIKSISIEGFIAGTANFVCNSWVQAKSQGKRIFFTTKSYLPSETPDGLKKLREQELQSLRGNGQGERKKGERIYDYDVYNDLGDPDSDQNLKRPVLGGSELPYPRRCRTGRPRCKTDPYSETRSSSVYVPRDEEFSEVKELTFGAKTLYSVLHALIPSLETTIVDSNLAFPYFTAIDSLFNEGVHLPPLKQNGWKDILPNLVKTLTDDAKDVLTFESPATFDRDRFFWFRDEEFARQTLAGLNPLSIKLITEWPLKSELDPKVYGPAESAITTEMIQQEIGGFMTVEEAIKQKKLFLLDYHDLFLPYVSKVRQLENTTLYGSRTVFFLTEDNTLRPLAIELVRPPIDGKPQWKHAFRPSWHSTSVWLWRLAKAHVLAHESGYHQLVSHWLRTHACTEPYIIAANRQLSAMHPIYRLLHPHFRYTMEINALAREALINAGGIIETSFSPGKYCMEMSAVIYDKLWRFDHEALPKDLISRGMAVEDPSAPYGGVRLTISDYPYASDGLILWDSIKSWVADYVNHYYPDSNLVLSDKELQNFWTEVRTVGHGDKKDQPWWPELKTTKDLIDILTTIIWVTSGHHAAVNFGQYTYAGYFPNRPTIARLKMPIEDPTDTDWKFFSEKPEAVLLTTFPSQVQATKVMAVLDVLSNHSPDEEYLGKEIEPAWAEDRDIKAAFEKFSGRLTELEGIVDERNANPELKNRNGAGIVPYELLKPFSESGVTGRGVPNSISI